MRRIGRCLSFTVPALLCLIFFSTCDTGTNPIPPAPGKTALAAPQVTINETNFTLMWDSVPNAAKYTVRIDGSDKWSGTSTTYPLAELANVEGVHQISVQAAAAPNDSTYGDSAFSAPLACEPADYVFVYEDAPGSGSKAVITSDEIIIKGLTSYGASLANIVIPRAIQGATVVTIGGTAFNGKTALVTVEIADTVANVEAGAFSGCLQLTTVTFKKSASDEGTATQLGAGVFTGCGVLANIIVPKDSKNDYKTIIDEKAPELAGKIVETTDSVPVDTVTLLPAAFELSLKPTGETVTRKLNLTVTPNNATNPAVTWKSSDPDIAKVDNNGIVTAVGPGTATITVTSVADSGKTAESTVTVIGAFYAVSEVTLNETQLTLDIGDSGALTATVAPSNATNQNVAWSSSDSSVATVDNLGNVTAKKAGTATITVTSVSGGKKASCVVTVKTPDEGVIAVTGVSVSPEEHTFEKAGETKKLEATVMPGNAANKNVMWKSDNINVARVDNNGNVTAVAPGFAKITVTTASGSKTADCFVTVKSIPVTGVTIDKPELSLTIGGSSPLTAGVEPADASNKDVIWSSNDESVASVDNDGLVTAVGEGTATITVTSAADGSKKAECVVTVKAPAPDKIAVAGVSLSSNALTFESVGDSEELTVTVTPDNATNKAVWWKSDSPGIASVTTDGIVTAKAPGTTKITVTSEDGSKTAICVVTVKAAPDPGGTHQYTVTVELAAGSDKQVVKPGPYTYTVGESLTIPLETGYTLYEWYLAGALMQEDKIVLTGLGVGFYSVQVIAHDGNGVPYSNDLYVTVAEGGGQVPENTEYQVNIEVESFEDPRFITNDSSDVILPGQDYKIFIAEGYTVYEWYLEGELQTTTENPIVISAPAPGFHLIKVVAERGGIPYTNELALNVSQ